MLYLIPQFTHRTRVVRHPRSYRTTPATLFDYREFSTGQNTVRFLHIHLVTILLLAAMGFADERWDIEILPVSKIEPGMRGVGKTVFYGDQIEEFGVEVLDIADNFYPHQDVILVRLFGPKAEYAGVVSGMSGSPVYIDGKLIGALALRLGQFMKEPIGGIMPIENMLRVAEKESVREIEMTGRVSLLSEYLISALCGTDKGFWTDLLSSAVPINRFAETSLQPIHSPLVFSGVNSQLISDYDELFKSMGFIATQGGHGMKNSETPTEFKPGSAISQVFISGDVGIEVSGTVTAVQDNRLLAFGHYIFNLGPVNLPLAHTRILATLPSLMGSSKMASSTKIVGTMRQDRLSGVYGDLNITPKMVPVVLRTSSPVDGENEFHFEMALDHSMNNLLPFYLRIALVQAMTSASLSAGLNSTRLQGKIDLTDGRSIDISDFFSTTQRLGYFAPGSDAAAAGDLIAGVLGVLMVNDFKSPDVSKISLSTHVVPGERVAKIHSIEQDRSVMNPGDSLQLNIKLKTSMDEEINITRFLKIPQKIETNRLIVLAAGASSLTRYEVLTNREKFIPVDYEHLLKILEERRRNDRIYIQIRSMDNGMIIDGTELTSLPPSVLDVVDSYATNGTSKRLQDRVLFEEQIPVDNVVTGLKRVVVRIEPKPKATVPEYNEKKSNTVKYWY